MRLPVLFLFLLIGRICFGQTNQKATALDIDSLISARTLAVLGKSFPSFIATDKGTKVSNELLNGKVVLINFWFEGCHPCMKEMPMLVSLYNKLKNTNGFLFLSFTWDNKDAIQRVNDKFGIDFKILSVSYDDCHQLNFKNGYPTTFVLDKQGNIKFAHGGFLDVSADIKGDVHEYLESKLLNEVKSLL